MHLLAVDLVHICFEFPAGIFPPEEIGLPLHRGARDTIRLQSDDLAQRGHECLLSDIRGKTEPRLPGGDSFAHQGSRGYGRSPRG